MSTSSPESPMRESHSSPPAAKTTSYEPKHDAADFHPANATARPKHMLRWFSTGKDRTTKRKPVNDTYAMDSKSKSKEKEEEEFAYKNQFGEIVRLRQAHTYLSTTRYVPRALRVQATHDARKAHPTSLWKQTPIKGSIPTAFKLAEWALAPSERAWVADAETGAQKQGRRSVVGVLASCVRVMLVGFPLQVYLALPLGMTPPWEDDDADDAYLEWPGFLWRWPRYAVNPLDMAPGSPYAVKRKYSAKGRLLRPRILVVREGKGEGEEEKWVPVNLEEHPERFRPYVFISYTNDHWHTSSAGDDNRRDVLEQLAPRLAAEAHCDAYWMDFQCRAPLTDPTLLDADVNRFCDVVRCAKRVVVVLPDAKPETGRVWGDRMWTLPEGLLATGDVVRFHYADTGVTEALHKVEVATSIWRDQEDREDCQGEGAEPIQATRLLAEHFTGTLSLSRLELFSTALYALADRAPSVNKTAARHELVYALMGLLHRRLDPTPGESQFQCMARLSLINDSDRLIERMLCLLPPHHADAYEDSNAHEGDVFGQLAREDQFGTSLWDVHPLGEIVGVADEDHTVIVDGARAISIRWKNFPRLKWRRDGGFGRLLAELFLRSGVWWFATGAGLAWTYAPIFIDTTSENLQLLLAGAIIVFVGIGALLSVVGPFAVRRLYGGAVVQSAPHLVGVEGTLPIAELERVVFGNCIGRLTYEPSSTPFCVANRSPTERVGTEPAWIASPQTHPPPALPPGYRLFTLVDTGMMTVSVFSAVRPPTVALVAGREGGMLRALLCSWSARQDRLVRETVLRMSSEVYDMASAKGWVKVCIEDPTQVVL